MKRIFGLTILLIISYSSLSAQNKCYLNEINNSDSIKAVVHLIKQKYIGGTTTENKKERAREAGKELYDLSYTIKNKALKAYVLYESGRSYWNWGFNSEAIKMLSKSISNQKCARAYETRADCKYKLNLYLSAAQDFEMYFQLEPDPRHSNRLDIAHCYFELQMFKESKKHLSHLINFQKNNPAKSSYMEEIYDERFGQAYIYRAYCNNNLGLKKEACIDLAKAANYAPSEVIQPKQELDCN
jgi:tetratricopeptide (TPR) repeat protein